MPKIRHCTSFTSRLSSLCSPPPQLGESSIPADLQAALPGIPQTRDVSDRLKTMQFPLQLESLTVCQLSGIGLC